MNKKAVLVVAEALAFRSSSVVPPGGENISFCSSKKLSKYSIPIITSHKAP